MHCAAIICTHSNIITHCDITMDIPNNIITHCDFTMYIPSNVITHCDVTMSGHCDVILIDLLWPDWSSDHHIGDLISLYHIKIGHSMEYHILPGKNLVTNTGIIKCVVPTLVWYICLPFLTLHSNSPQYEIILIPTCTSGKDVRYATESYFTQRWVWQLGLYTLSLSHLTLVCSQKASGVMCLIYR